MMKSRGGRVVGLDRRVLRGLGGRGRVLLLGVGLSRGLFLGLGVVRGLCLGVLLGLRLGDWIDLITYYFII